MKSNNIRDVVAGNLTRDVVTGNLSSESCNEWGTDCPELPREVVVVNEPVACADEWECQRRAEITEVVTNNIRDIVKGNLIRDVVSGNLKKSKKKEAEKINFKEMLDDKINKDLEKAMAKASKGKARTVVNTTLIRDVVKSALWEELDGILEEIDN